MSKKVPNLKPKNTRTSASLEKKACQMILIEIKTKKGT